MKASRASSRVAVWLTAGSAVLVGGLLFLTAPGLISKIHAQQSDRTVLLALDAESLNALQSWPAAQDVPCTHIVLDAVVSVSQEQTVRSLKKAVVWRVGDISDPAAFIERVQPGDWIWLTDENALEHPLLFLELPKRLTNGGVCALEFDNNRPLQAWSSRAKMPVVKTHYLGTREMLTPNTATWKARLVRAVEERWVRCLVVHLSPALTPLENIRFLTSVAASLQSHGYVIENQRTRLEWPVSGISTSKRWSLVLLLSVLIPVLILYWVRRLDFGPMTLFVGVSSISVLIGVLIHSLGATPAFVLGMAPLRGIKIQLCGALLLALPFLFSRNDVGALTHPDVSRRSFAIWGGLAFLVVALYWMRSGNHPLFPVSDAERSVRDALETFFTARPRFKEFLFGHPLFYLGLVLNRQPVQDRWWGDGRLFLWLGLVGQVSILNTFTHFHAPFFYCVVRTLHGLWLGLALALVAQRVLHLKQ